MEKPPWDGLRAAFYLVAVLLAYQSLLVGLSLAWCLFKASDQILAGTFECNKDGRLTELLQLAVSTAMAFGMAFINRKEK